MEDRCATFRLMVDYDMSIEDALADGKYDSVHEEVNSKNFPSDRTLGQVETEIVLHRPCRFASLDEIVDTERVWQSLYALGLRPANIHELLAFGIAFPDVQVLHTCVVALGSEWRNSKGKPLVPALTGTIDCTSRRYRRVNLFFSHGSNTDDFGVWHTDDNVFASVHI